MTTTTSEATMTSQPSPDDTDGAGPEPLGPGWLTVTVVIGVMAALIALAGMTLSFHAVSVRMTPSFGPRWAWLVPLVVDLTVLVFSGVDLVLNRLGMSHPLARWTVYGATFGTVWLNYAAGGDPTGRIAHVLMPAVWVMFVELMRHVVRRTALHAGGSLRQPIPAARWILSPWPTLKLWRRMVLWRVHSYPRALEQERVRLARVAAMRDEHGRAWRWRVSALDRLSIDLGEAATPRATPAADTPGTPVGVTPPSGDTPPETPPQESDTPAVALPPHDTTLPVPQPHVTPKARTAAAATPPAPRVTVPLAHDLDADLKILDDDGPPAWSDMSKAEAVRRVDDLLPGRVASHVVALLAARGVTVDKFQVRGTRSRRRRSDTPAGDTPRDADDTPERDAA